MSKIFFHYSDNTINKVREAKEIKLFLLNLFKEQKILIKRVDYISPLLVDLSVKTPIQ